MPSRAQADGSALRLRQVVDRRTNRYVKQLSDPATEEVLMYVAKPLDEHQDHGSAKPGLRRRRARRN
jgi:hypothetical protein